MRAAVLHGKGDLRVEEVDTPEAGLDEVLVRVAACGICRTDLHYLHGVPTFRKPPLILGHEISGVVEASPTGTPPVGTRVLIPPVLPCGRCPYCQAGRGTLCQKMVMLGSHRDGGLAEYIAVPASAAFPLPDSVPLEEGSILSDAFSTPYHAVTNRAEIRPGMSVAVFGCGGVGLAAVRMAVLAGGRVVAVDLAKEKLDLALGLGAETIVDAANQEVVPAIREATDGGVEVALEVIGRPETIRQAFDSLRRGGRLVVVGYTAEQVPINGARLMFRELEVRGSLGCGLQDFPKVIDLASRGLLDVQRFVTHRFSLEEVKDGFQLLASGDPTLVRSVALPSS